ncbi:MAG: DUF2155 domain-containing protein [Parvularculaceae bacterium]
MRPIAIAAAIATLLAGVAAQEGDPVLDALNQTPAGPSELDALSQGAESDFPDIEKAAARQPVSVTVRALNKVTAKYTDIVINMDETAKYGTLELTPRYCDKRPPEEFPETTAFIEIVDAGGKRKSNFKIEPKEAEVDAPVNEVAHAGTDAALPGAAPALPENMIFSGWMFASSPALNGLEHAVYDVWVIDCKTVSVDN